MKKICIIFIKVIVVVGIVLLMSNTIINILYENKISSTVNNINTEKSFEQKESIDELRQSWPVLSVEERGGISPECAMDIALAYLEQSSTWKNKSMIEKIFFTKLYISESLDGTYYDVFYLGRLSGNYFGFYDYDTHVVISKSNGAILHSWVGE